MNANTIGNSVSATTRLATCALAACAVAGAISLPSESRADVIYENDFATRTSEKPIPSMKWRQYDYVTGPMVNTNYTKPFDGTGNSSSQQIQDGWIKDHVFSSTAAASIGNAHIYADEGNPMAVLGHGATTRAIVIKQRIGNTFTNGIVTVQFDFLPTKTWASYTDQITKRAFLSIGDEDFYSPEGSRTSMFEHTAANVGIAIDNSLRKAYYRSTNAVYSADTVTKGNWFRAVTTINLDTRKYDYTLYDLGTGHPTLDTATPSSPVYSASNIAFPDDALASASSIGLCAYGVAWDANGNTENFPERAVCFDNIRIAHNNQECYVNDFSSRQYRNLAEGTTSAAYVADGFVTTNKAPNEMYTYPPQDSTGISIVPARVKNNATIEPVGLDGWRRLIPEDGADATNRVQLYRHRTYSGEDPVMRFTSEATVGVACPIGSTLSNGLVRMVADMRVPSSWGSKSNGRMWMSLGNDTLYTGYLSGYKKGRFVHAGIAAPNDGKGTNGIPCYINSSGTTVKDSPVRTKMSTWYRGEIVADLDTGKFDYVLYEQGENHPSVNDSNGTVVFEIKNATKMNNANVTTISTFALWAISVGAYFDSVQIWHKAPGATDETQLYYNSMRYRNVYPQGLKVGALTGTIINNPEGQDRWVSINTGTKSAVVTDDDNPAMTFGDNYTGYAVHDLGQTVRTGTLVAQVDIRPPRSWMNQSGGAYFRLGGDKHFEGGLGGVNDAASFLNWCAGGFGFKTFSNAKDECGMTTNVTIVAMQGDGNGDGSMIAATQTTIIDPSHWYRFVATAHMSESLYDVAVYDMGTTQPTLATATPGATVATFQNLPFRHTNANLGGISCISANVNNTWSDVLDTSLQPYFDNIRVSTQQSAFVITVR